MKLSLAWLQHLRGKWWPLGIALLSFSLGGPVPPAFAAPALQEAPAPGAQPEHVPVSAPRTDIVYLNEATLSELMSLPGVGAKRAQAILDLRDKRGGKFKQVDEIVRVRGIGAKSLARLKPLLALNRPAASAAQDAANTAIATKSSTK